MWKRKDLKRQAKVALHRNYWKTILVALLITAVVSGTAGIGGAFSGIASGASIAQLTPNYDEVETVTTIVSTETESGDEDVVLSDEELGAAIEVVIHEMEEAEDGETLAVVLGILLVAFAIILLIVIVLSILMSAFLINPFLVGTYRFFVKNLQEPANISELGSGFDRNYKTNVVTLLLMDIYTFLWSLLLVIPGIVKSYEYRMIPYLLADDPTMTRKEAFACSKQMMKGNKWRAFVLDLSFIGWELLNALTSGILGTFYLNAYIYETNAALYLALKGGKDTHYEDVPVLKAGEMDL